ncbi:MAG: DUF2089 domain-containing protein [Chloroflexi bacterium]|nr:DUF2089 domain-containing protein [Chloroflexota bacterium]
MDDEQRRILQMVQEGAITPDEAARLLDALVEEALPAAGDGSPAPAPAPARAPDDVIAPGPAPRFRRYWEVPFAVGLILLGLAGVCVSSVSGVLLLCGWSAFVVAAIIALAGWWSRSAAWVHVRIRESDGDRLSFSLPLPMGLAGWGLGLAQRYVDDDTRANLDVAAGLLDMFRAADSNEPMTVEIDEEDGDHILVHIG